MFKQEIIKLVVLNFIYYKNNAIFVENTKLKQL